MRSPDDKVGGFLTSCVFLLVAFLYVVSFEPVTCSPINQPDGQTRNINSLSPEQKRRTLTIKVDFTGLSPEQRQHALIVLRQQMICNLRRAKRKPLPAYCFVTTTESVTTSMESTLEITTTPAGPTSVPVETTVEGTTSAGPTSVPAESTLEITTTSLGATSVPVESTLEITTTSLGATSVPVESTVESTTSAGPTSAPVDPLTTVDSGTTKSELPTTVGHIEIPPEERRRRNAVEKDNFSDQNLQSRIHLAPDAHPDGKRKRRDTSNVTATDCDELDYADDGQTDTGDIAEIHIFQLDDCDEDETQIIEALLTAANATKNDKTFEEQTNAKILGFDRYKITTEDKDLFTYKTWLPILIVLIVLLITIIILIHYGKGKKQTSRRRPRVEPLVPLNSSMNQAQPTPSEAANGPRPNGPGPREVDVNDGLLIPMTEFSNE